MMEQKAPSLIDKHVAGRIRLRRLQLGMSQEDLARALNVTCQQVQKYEKGANRVTAGRLHEIARVLTVPIQFFFEENPGCGDDVTDEDARRWSQIMASSDMVSFIQLLAGFRSPKIRRSMRDLALAVAEELREGGGPPDKG
ncbi:helix-turn-helix domain-containing protein [Microvirga sp. SM9]|nr:helix-turn-helix domain-containing protein [Microvirga lenta]